MILPLLTGYIVGKFSSKRIYAIMIGILLGAALGFIASYTFIPLLYPLFSGEAGLVVVPEFDSIGIMFLLPDFVIYTESVYFLTRSYLIDSVFVLNGAFFAALGALYGSTRHRRKVSAPF